MAKRVIFSDIHFGDRQCSLSSQSVALGLRSFLWELGTIDELILAGDILDANISSLTTAIEGKKNSGPWPKQLGFRQWLSHLFEDSNFDVARIVYIPGNHDYIIWNILSTNEAFVVPISEGKAPISLPLMQGTFSKPFIGGTAPARIRDRFQVIYPEYEFALAGRQVLVTHGHYLDEQQTLFKHLEELIRIEHGNRQEAIRKFFIGTAQYQVLANAVSFMKASRTFVEKAYKGVSAVFDAINVLGRLRDQPIDTNLLKAVEGYLYYFRGKEAPDVFVFGHTHNSGHASTSTLSQSKGKRLINKTIDVWNTGCFLGSRSTRPAGTFILIDDDPAVKDPIRLLQVDSKGNVKQKTC